jgi:hypothetical protein
VNLNFQTNSEITAKRHSIIDKDDVWVMSRGDVIGYPYGAKVKFLKETEVKTEDGVLDKFEEEEIKSFRINSEIEFQNDSELEYLNATVLERDKISKISPGNNLVWQNDDSLRLSGLSIISTDINEKSMSSYNNVFEIRGGNERGSVAIFASPDRLRVVKNKKMLKKIYRANSWIGPGQFKAYSQGDILLIESGTVL